MTDLTRRSFLPLLIAAPAIVKYANLMPVRAFKLPFITVTPMLAPLAELTYLENMIQQALIETLARTDPAIRYDEAGRKRLEDAVTKALDQSRICYPTPRRL